MRYSKYFMLALLLVACNTNTYTQPLLLKGYDWDNMEKLHLEHKLDEVSGIVYDNRSKSFLAVNDEKGNIYKVSADNYKIRHSIKFAGGGDYEAIGLKANIVFVMNSKGGLWEMELDDDKVRHVGNYEFPFDEKVEFEAMVLSEKGIIYLISKQSALNKVQKKTLFYSFNIRTKEYNKEVAKGVDWLEVKAKGGVDKLHVSGAAVHPFSKKIYIVASIEKLLIILNKDWKVEEVHSLDKKLFKQPEGITFNNEGDLFISNEAKDGRPNIIKIPVKR
ncbi:MAG: SdiA-regulated domain-containing protein [Flavipsychrobacter sp.]